MELDAEAVEKAAAAMDAAQDSFFETVGFETTPPSEFKKRLAKAAIRAYLSALKEDPEVVERVARAVYLGQFPKHPETYRGDVPKHYQQLVRAALSALEGHAP